MAFSNSSILSESQTIYGRDCKNIYSTDSSVPELPSFYHAFVLYSLEFADGTKCLLSIKSTDDVSKLQNDVNNAAVWSLSSDLFILKASLSMFIFGLNYLLISILVNGKPIKQLPKHKNPDIVFSCNLNWTDHCIIITTKAYQILGLIRQAFRINSIEAKRHLWCIHLLNQIRINALLTKYGAHS